MESNIYCFETTKGGPKRPCCAKQESGQPLDFYVAIKAIYNTDDKILQANVLNNGRWKLYETRLQVSQGKTISNPLSHVLQIIFFYKLDLPLFFYKKILFQGKYVIFRAEEVDSFYILGTLKERDFEVDPSGSLYVHDTDSRVRLEFPKGCVEKPEIFKVTVWLLF